MRIQPKALFRNGIAMLSIATILMAMVPDLASAATVRPITFPILGGGKFTNDYNAPRSNGVHNATDIFASKHTPLVSPVDGVIDYVISPQASWGYSLGIRDADGYRFNLVHMNNDKPGTDNGAGGEMNAYAPDMKKGNTVVKGQFLGWMGDSGNAETTPPHLHFEIYDPAGATINPYDSLVNADRISQPVKNPDTMPGEILPFGPFIGTKLQVAAGNLDLDADDELVVSPGVGSTPIVRVLTRQGVFDNKEFMAYDPSFMGGVTVAAGDVDGDGVDEIITGTGPGNRTHVKVFDPNGGIKGSFFAYGNYTSGVTVAAGDINGDGIDEIITGTGPQSSTHVKVFNMLGQEQSNFFAYPGYSPGVNIGVGDTDGDGTDDIVTAPGPGGSAHIKIFSGAGAVKSNFFAYDNFYGGVSVDVGNIKTNTLAQEIITSPYSNGGADIRLYGSGGSIISSKGLYETWWTGGYDVAAGNGFSWVGTGGDRRGSMRAGPN